MIYGIDVSHGLALDCQSAANLAAVKGNHVPYAFYWYAETAAESGAKREAAFVLSKIRGTSPLFVTYDADVVLLPRSDCRRCWYERIF